MYIRYIIKLHNKLIKHRAKTMKLSNKRKSELRIKTLTHRYNVYKCMVLDSVKRNGWLNIEAKRHLKAMNDSLSIIAIEKSVYS